MIIIKYKINNEFTKFTKLKWKIKTISKKDKFSNKNKYLKVKIR